MEGSWEEVELNFFSRSWRWRWVLYADGGAEVGSWWLMRCCAVLCCAVPAGISETKQPRSAGTADAITCQRQLPSSQVTRRWTPTDLLLMPMWIRSR